MIPPAHKSRPDFPLLLEPRLDAKIWGGRKLETVLGKTLPADERVGESLESAAESLIASGQLQGMRVAELIEQFPDDVLGRLGQQVSANRPDLPLLAKLIDASDVLSVQVHPDDDGARRLGKRGKTEAWYIVAADTGSRLVTGIKPWQGVQEVQNAIESGTLEELLVTTPVAAGDTFYIPAGTTHAIGAGILLYEIQQTSDVTFRMFDWNRLDDLGRPRELHVAESLEAVRIESQARPVTALTINDHRTLLVACRYFALERWQFATGPVDMEFDGESFRLITVLDGELTVSTSNGSVTVGRGQTALLPAAVNNATFAGDCAQLVSYVPDLAGRIVPELLAAGHALDAIESTVFDVPTDISGIE